MAYKVDITNKARKQFNALPSVIKPRVSEAINDLADNPRPHQCIKLEADLGYRISVGDYRVLYAIDDRAQLVVVYRVKHRREAYRGN